MHPLFLLVLKVSVFFVPALLIVSVIRRYPAALRWARQPSFMLALLALGAVLLTTACNTLNTISALLPALGALASNIVTFVITLKGGTVSASVTAAIQKWQFDVATEIAEAKIIIAAATSSTTATTLQKLQAIFTAVSANLGTILAGANITDSATLSKLTSLAGLFIATVQTVLGIIISLQPQAAALATGALSKEDAGTADKHASALIDHNHRLMKSTFDTIKQGVTPSADVNQALAAMKELP